MLLAALIFFGTRLVVQNFRVEGPSMRPNLINSQFLLVSKLAYLAGEPQRGDIIVFRSPRRSSEDLVKRVVGLPNETVEIRGGSVYVNGQRLDEADYLDVRTRPDMRLRPVPVDSYYVLGDNRPESRDSRSLGAIPRASIVGRVWLIYWPPDRFGVVDDGHAQLQPVPQRVALPAAA